MIGRLLTGLALFELAQPLFRRALRPFRRGRKADAPPAGRRYVLERSVLVPAPVEETARFFEEPANLAEITPVWLGFRIRKLDKLPMQEGTTIEYEIKPFRLPQRWATKIVEYEPARRFVDVQMRGPYKFWRHEHTFEHAEGGTLVRDRVEYQMPFGLIGRIAHALVVGPQLRRIFSYREQATARAFEQERAA
jgi:ligand-binding SRPBCC domain-containing protein